MIKSAATKRSKFEQLHVPPWLIVLEFAFSALLLYLLSSAPGMSLVQEPVIAQVASPTVVAESTITRQNSHTPTLNTATLQTRLD